MDFKTTEEVLKVVRRAIKEGRRDRSYWWSDASRVSVLTRVYVYKGMEFHVPNTRGHYVYVRPVGAHEEDSIPLAVVR